MNEYFTIGSVSSNDYGIILTEILTWDTPEREVRFEPIPGRRDTLTIVDGRFKNVDISYCGLIKKNFLAEFCRFRNAILPLKGYQKITDSTDPDHYRMGIIHNAVHGDPKERGEVGAVELSVTCKPQRFLVSGEQITTISRSGNAISNPTAYDAKPLLKVYGSGTGTLTVAGTQIQIKKAINQHLYLDCETMEAYRQAGAMEPWNSNVSAPAYPVLRPGSNTISWTGGISRVEVTARWWEL